MNEHAPSVRLSGAGITGAPTPPGREFIEPDAWASCDNAKQHGERIADYVARRIQDGSMDAARGSELLRAFIVSYADHMAAHGASRKELVLWTRAHEAAFDSRSPLLET